VRVRLAAARRKDEQAALINYYHYVISVNIYIRKLLFTPLAIAHRPFELTKIPLLSHFVVEKTMENIFVSQVTKL
jgi:hypothetical protein